MLETAWTARVQANDARLDALRDIVRNADRQVDQLLDRAVETESKAMAKAYEQRIERVQTEKLEAMEKLETLSKPKLSFEATIGTALAFLENPLKLWTSDRLEDRRLALRLVFATNLKCDRHPI